MASRRGKGPLVPPKESPNKDLPAPTTNAPTTRSQEPQQYEDTQLLAIKLSRQTDKVARFESHQEYLIACVKDKLIPANFRIEIDSSIGNPDETFLTNWYEKIRNLSIELMKDTIKFCEKTITKAKTEIKSLEDDIKHQTEEEEYKEIQTAITKYNEQKTKELQKIKTDKHRKPRWNFASKETSKTEEELLTHK